ncbi:MAG: hypothetical protein R3F48_00345 [Candidatus Zixiibacteriota bacterium]
MRIIKLIWLGFALASLLCGGCSQQSTSNAPQEWDFNAQKVWEISQIDGAQLARPAEPRVADDGTLYVHDFEQHVSYIIGADGTIRGSFAPRGENESEVPFYLNCFPAGEQVVVCAPDKLHFFTNQGQFVKAVPNNLFVRFPLAFKNENECWLAPGALGDSPDGVAAVTCINFATGEEKNIYTFDLTGDETKPTGGAVVVGLTPQAKMGYDRKADRIYFGKNTDTLLYCSGSGDDTIETISIDGVRTPISEEVKRKYFADLGIPEEHVAAIVGNLPEKMACYNTIQIIDGLVYIISAHEISRTLPGLFVNVYSPSGQHLYYGEVHVEEGWHLASPDNLQFGSGCVYAVQENDAGNKKIVKYTIKSCT